MVYKLPEELIAELRTDLTALAGQVSALTKRVEKPHLTLEAIQARVRERVRELAAEIDALKAAQRGENF